jgi:hypothetical protein
MELSQGGDQRMDISARYINMISKQMTRIGDYQKSAKVQGFRFRMGGGQAMVALYNRKVFSFIIPNNIGNQ